MMTAKDRTLWRSLPATNRDLAFCAALKGLGQLFQLLREVRRELGPKQARSGLSFQSQQCKQENSCWILSSLWHLLMSDHKNHGEVTISP